MSRTSQEKACHGTPFLYMSKLSVSDVSPVEW